MTQRRLGERGGSLHPRLEDALGAIERYAHARCCRQQALCGHFAGGSGSDDAPCNACDMCLDPEGAHATMPVREPIEALSAADHQLIVDAVGALSRSIGKGNLARALRGSQAKAMTAHGLLHLPQHGALKDRSEPAIVAAIDQLIRERRLVRRGRKYPTVALPGAGKARKQRTMRERVPEMSTLTRQQSLFETAQASKSVRASRVSSIKLALDTYRRQKARQLKWKAYMIFHRKTIAAIDAKRPQTSDELAQIPGLGPSKIARFGEDILAIVRRYDQP